MTGLFYQNFPIRNALRPELSWTHYLRLLRVEDGTALLRQHGIRVLAPERLEEVFGVLGGVISIDRQNSRN